MADLDEYVVDKGLCIDCNACYTTYPEIFKQVPFEGETKAEAHTPIETGKVNPWDVVGVCPTDAISKKGEMPEKPELEEGALPPLEDLGPWEDRWERVKDQKDSKWEVMKRYGMAATVTEEKNRYLIRVALPEKSPIHKTRFKMGLSDYMPDYDIDVQLNDAQDEVIVIGKMTDPHFKLLTGKINSFPDRFKRSFKLAHKVEILRNAYRSKVLNLELKKIDAVANAA